MGYSSFCVCLVTNDDDQVLGLEKKKEKNQKAQGKGISGRSHFVSVIKTLSECDHI